VMPLAPVEPTLMPDVPAAGVMGTIKPCALTVSGVAVLKEMPAD